MILIMSLEFILADRSSCLEEEFRAYRDAIYYHAFMTEQSWSSGTVEITGLSQKHSAPHVVCVQWTKSFFFLLLFVYERASQNSNLQNMKVSSMKFLAYYFVSYRGGLFLNGIYDKCSHLATSWLFIFGFL